MVDGCAFAAKLGVIQHIIVDEGGHVDHFDDGGEDGVGVGEFAGGFAGEEDEEWAEHFSAESGNMFAECIDGGEFAVEFAVEEFLDGVQFRTDGLAERVQNGEGGTRLCHMDGHYMD
jgi:hypothetical protein